MSFPGSLRHSLVRDVSEIPCLLLNVLGSALLHSLALINYMVIYTSADQRYETKVLLAIIS